MSTVSLFERLKGVVWEKAESRRVTFAALVADLVNDVEIDDAEIVVTLEASGRSLAELEAAVSLGKERLRLTALLETETAEREAFKKLEAEQKAVKAELDEATKKATIKLIRLADEIARGSSDLLKFGRARERLHMLRDASEVQAEAAEGKRAAAAQSRLVENRRELADLQYKLDSGAMLIGKNDRVGILRGRIADDEKILASHLAKGAT